MQGCFIAVHQTIFDMVLGCYMDSTTGLDLAAYRALFSSSLDNIVCSMTQVCFVDKIVAKFGHSNKTKLRVCNLAKMQPCNNLNYL